MDGLRTIAVVPVVLFHAGFDLFSGGFVGVDVFFVISGYLITGIILSEVLAGNFNIIKFYERRARRILPALFLVILACLPFAWVLLSPRDLKDFSESLVAVSLFGSNFLFWKESGYFEGAAELKPLLHTWSLAVEEQYYVLFPMALMLAWRLGLRWMLAFFAAVFAASLAAAQWGAVHAPAANFYLLPTRSWELLIGAFVAMASLDKRRLNFSVAKKEVGAWIGLALIVYAIFFFDKETPFPSLYSLVPTVGAALIIVCATQETIAGKFIANKWFVGIGLISYSLYLWHQPLFAFARHAGYGESDKVVFGFLSVFAVLLAYLSWRYVESPFRNGWRFDRKQIFSYGTAGSVALIALGLAGHVKNGFMEMKATRDQLVVLKSITPSPRRADCHTAGESFIKAKDACEYHAGKLSWAAFGDSHAVELAYAMADELAAYGLSLKHFSFSNCVPTFGRTVGGQFKYCSEWTDQAAKYIAENKDIRNVVVSYRINNWLFGGHTGKYPRLVDDVGQSEREKVWNSYVNVLRHFVGSGKKVFLVLQAPEIPKSIDELVLEAGDARGRIYGADASWWKSRSEYLRARLHEIPREVTIIDPAQIFCDEAKCMAANGGVAYYFDDNHLTVAGAKLVAAGLMQSVGF
ncbi:acyltransferase family protein [Azohydromonas caseinilytica]|uniref:Acyltransferase n=1 Tax=Azohydromonas caseinilytica TaxID=2728836 RepID=A0A848F9J6_9BURK|nr:acyltransferase family protein [Azohydromonas caseinilytica]NML16214.1 acyltransferase [Azohydromonas caseinilytica]